MKYFLIVSGKKERINWNVRWFINTKLKVHVNEKKSSKYSAVKQRDGRIVKKKGYPRA